MNVDPTHRYKRQRSLSSSSSSSASSSLSCSSISDIPTKYHRSLSLSSETFICSLPPTCNTLETPASFDTQEELERHQESFHKYVCHAVIRDRTAESIASGNQANKGKERDDAGMPLGFVGRSGGKIWKECGKVFPEERLFELHQIETHDPLWREKQARGNKIFQCFLPPEQCSKTFLTPAKRRRHLIDKHKYPQQYFFGITNHGLNLLASTDGIGVSLIRPRKDLPPTSSSSPSQDTLAAPLDPFRPSPDIVAHHGHQSGKTPRQDKAVPLATTQSKGMKGEEEDRSARPVEVAKIGGGEEKVGHDEDIDMDSLVASTANLDGLGSSLAFLPRGLRSKKPGGGGLKIDCPM